MNLVWLLTVFGCTSLSLVLLSRGHYIRYGWLFTSAILSVILDSYFWYLKHFHQSLYRPSRDMIFFLFLGLGGMVAWEAWRWKNMFVMIPQEVQIFLGLILHIARQRVGNTWGVYYFDCALQILNLLIIAGFLILFSRTPSQLREFTDEPLQARPR